MSTSPPPTIGSCRAFCHGDRPARAHPQAGLFCGEARLVDGRTGEFPADRPPVRPIYRAGAVDAAGTRNLLRHIDNWILTGSAVFRRDAVIAAGGFDKRLGSFADGFLARKIALMHGFCYSPQAIAVWCVYGDSYSLKTAGDIARADGSCRRPCAVGRRNGISELVLRCVRGSLEIRNRTPRPHDRADRPGPGHGDGGHVRA